MYIFIFAQQDEVPITMYSEASKVWHLTKESTLSGVFHIPAVKSIFQLSKGYSSCQKHIPAVKSIFQLTSAEGIIAQLLFNMQTPDRRTTYYLLLELYKSKHIAFMLSNLSQKWSGSLLHTSA